MSKEETSEYYQETAGTAVTLTSQGKLVFRRVIRKAWCIRDDGVDKKMEGAVKAGLDTTL